MREATQVQASYVCCVAADSFVLYPVGEDASEADVMLASLAVRLTRLAVEWLAGQALAHSPFCLGITRSGAAHRAPAGALLTAMLTGLAIGESSRGDLREHLLNGTRTGLWASSSPIRFAWGGC